MNEIQKRIHTLLLREGASLIGFAPLADIPFSVHFPLPFAVSIAVALQPSIIAGILQGPTREYHQEYLRLNQLLSHLAITTGDVLNNAGYQAVILLPTTENFDPHTLSADFPHKTAATLSGLGWIGKSALLVTETYGSAIRLTTVLTNAPLDTKPKREPSRCRNCTLCVEACPAHAIRGISWTPQLPRDEYYDAFACRETARKLAQSKSIDSTICGICISVCPWTRAYLTREGAR
ncbi:MAG: 4Fe-4S double cluster binding domain-containing protein [Atribacterota bacterium]|nr:4Fe-4S binding protein [Candidatus Atribacteria bacterium]